MSGTVRWWNGAIEATSEDGTRVVLDVDWSDRLLQLLGRYPEDFEVAERALRVFQLFYDDAVERIAQGVKLVPEGSPERVIAERAFFGTNGLRDPKTGESRRTRFDGGDAPDDRLHVGDAVEHKVYRRLGRIDRFVHGSPGFAADETTDFYLDDHTGPYKQCDFVKLRPTSVKSR